MPETLARQVAAVQSAHPLTEEFFSWCAQEAPSGLLEGIDDRLEAEALYSDAWFYDLCGVSLHVLYGRYSGQDKGSNWHELEGGNGAALLQYLRALSPGVRIYADGTLELEQPEL